MTCQDFIDILVNEYFYDGMIDDDYWNDDFDSEWYFDATLKEARERGVTLSDADTFDYDKEFYEMYRNTEKGLS